MRTLVLIALGFVPVLGCRESSSVAADKSAAKDAPVASAAPTAAPAKSADEANTLLAKAPIIEAETYRIELVGPAGVKQGEAFEFTVKLSARGGYHVNQEYTTKFKTAGDGLTFEPEILAKEQLTLSEMNAELKGKAKASSAGPKTVSGRLFFSVCTEEKCLIEKGDVALIIPAS